jgi:hypothetical protein
MFFVMSLSQTSARRNITVWSASMPEKLSRARNRLTYRAAIHESRVDHQSQDREGLGIDVSSTLLARADEVIE